MAKVSTELEVLVKIAGDAGLDKLTRTLNGLGRQAKSAAAPFDQISKELKDVQRTSKNSIANLRGYRNAWRDITQQVEIGSAAFKEATAEAARLDKQLQKAEGRKGPKGGGRLRAAAQVAGTVAGAGVFGGPEGAAGALLGSIGGPGGAIVGGAIGAQVGQLRQALGAVAEYSAGLDKLRIALKGVTTSQEQYQAGLKFIQQTTKDFAIPQEIVTRQFTKLQASVQGAGGDLEDTKTAFNGIVAAVRATGGSLSDVDAALTATAQVFSKGKVSAEELRQQIGERLPGAFTLFAESMGLTPQELDKALEDGKVSLQDFQGFAEAIFKRYGENAQAIADAPQSAGDRLKVSLERLNETVGRILQPIGAQFQETFTDIAEAINTAVQALDKFFGISDQQRQNALITQVNALNQNIARTKRLAEGFQAEINKDGDFLGQRQNQIDSANRLIAEFEAKRQKLRAELNALTSGEASSIDVQQPTAGGGLPGIIVDGTDPGGSQAKIKDTSDEILRLTQEMNAASATRQLILAEQLRLQIDIQRITEQFNAGEITFNRAQELSLNAIEKSRKRGLKLRDDEKKAMRDLTKGQKEFKKELTETEKLVKSIENTLATSMASAIEGLIDGTKSLSESLSGVLRQMASLLLNFGTKSLMGSIFPSANGNVYANNKIVPFASGGVVNKPTIFPMANGMGLMGEAGPEAIMPLRRGANGKLGVEASGGVGNVVVNVDAAGSNVQGDQPNAKALGSAIGAAVQAELIKQKRPGGLLS